MKTFTIFLAFLLLATNVASAQNINFGTEASVQAQTNVEVNTNANVNVNARGNAGAEGNSTSSEQMRGNSNANANASVDASATSSNVRLNAREIRGWSEGEKAEFMMNVKSHAELRSGQDLSNFARGILAADANVESVDATEERVEVRYKLPAKFLGIFGTELSAITGVTFGPRASTTPGEVKVTFPWYHMFFSLDSDVRAEMLESAVQSRVESDVEVRNTNANVNARNGRVIQLISSILSGIRANVEAEAEAEAQADVSN